MYTYTLNGQPVTPPDTWEINLVQNEGQIFWRRELSGDIEFKGDDYAYLLTQSECTELTFIIYCDGDVFWTGIFKYPYDFHFDTDACIATGTPEVEDEYSCIMNKYDTEYPVQEFYDSLISTPGYVYPICNIPDCLGGFVGQVGSTNQAVRLDFMFDGFFQGVSGTGKKYMDCDLDVVSSFFFLDEFPGYPAGHYNSIFGTNNYVTGAANLLGAVLFIMNTTVRQDFGGTACPEQHDTITFQFMESVLRDRFNAYWFIDSNGDFRIEHVSYFLPGFLYSDYGAGIDITSITWKGRSYAYRKNKYQHQTDKLFDQEKFSWQHYWGTEGGVTHGLDFQGVPIYYGAARDTKFDCVPGEFKEKDLATPKLWTDIAWGFALLNADDISCNGWLMICTNFDGINNFCNILCEAGALTNTSIANGHLSTANLMLHYFTWDRIFLTGHLNNGATAPQVEITVFDSAIKKKLQDEIEIPLCCSDEFDPMDYITTEMGNGSLHSATQTPHSLKVQLLYD